MAEKKLEERAWKAAEHQAKKAEKEAEKTRLLAEWMATQDRGRGGRGHGHGHGRGCGRGHGHGGGGGAASIAQESDITGSEELSDSDPALTDRDDVPTLETGITQQNLHLPHACRKRAPRFLPEDDEEEDEAPPIVCP